MKQGIAALLTGAFLVVALVLLCIFNLTKPRVLVLHSSGRGASSVKDMDEGIREVLDQNRQPISVRWHYLEIDSLPDEAHRLEVAREGQRAVEQFDPDVVIAVDDEAQQYVAQRYAGHVRPKVVFAAIDQDPRSYGYSNAANVTGVFEALPLPAVRDTLLQVHPNQAANQPTRIAAVSLAGATGDGQLRQVQAFNWAPNRLVAVDSVRDFPAWQKAINELAGKADVVLVLSYDGLQVAPNAKEVVRPGDVVKWTEAHAKPFPLGISVDYTQQGGGLSVASSPREIGEKAAKQALTLIKAANDSPPPIVQGLQYRVAVRESVLEARQVYLPSIYLTAARLDELYYP